jgi:hypothetical protein
MSKQLAILGAGPIGIEAALYARSLGFDVVLYERGLVAAASVADWGHVHLFTPWKMNITTLGVETLRRHNRWPEFPADVCPTGEEFRRHYLLPLTECGLLQGCLRVETTVLRVGRHDHHKSDAIGSPERAENGFRILVEDSSGQQRVDHADIVLDCSGTYSHHRWAGRGGIPAPGESGLEDQIRYNLPDPIERDRPAFVDKHSLLLGCGYSAATFLKEIELLNRAHPSTRVTWAIRRPGQAIQEINADPLPARRHLVQAAIKMAQEPPEWLTFMPNVALESVDHANNVFVAHFARLDDATRTDPHPAVRCDNIVAMVGYAPDVSVYDQLQIHSCYATAGPMNLAAALLGEAGADCLTAGAGLTADTLKNPEPNFYILGAKSYGTNSNFLIQVGHAQIRDVFKLIQPNAPVLV